MNLKSLLKDDDAVSPVIGVILMVAITVILAAVIGTFVLGLGDQVSDNAPQVSFTFDYDSSSGTADCSPGFGAGAGVGYLTVTHDGGDKVNADDLSITDGSSSLQVGTNCLPAGSDVTAGTSFTADTVESSDTVRIIWEGSSDSATLAKWTGPDA